jgi:hypothetical protein
MDATGTQVAALVPDNQPIKEQIKISQISKPYRSNI